MTFEDFGDLEPLAAGPGNLADHQQVPRSLAQALKSTVRKGPAKALKTPPKMQLSREIGFSIPTPPKPTPESESLDMGSSQRGRARKAPQKLADFQVRLASKPPTPVSKAASESEEPKRKRAREDPEPSTTSAPQVGGTAGFEPMGELLQPTTKVK